LSEVQSIPTELLPTSLFPTWKQEVSAKVAAHQMRHNLSNLSNGGTSSRDSSNSGSLDSGKATLDATNSSAVFLGRTKYPQLMARVAARYAQSLDRLSAATEPQGPRSVNAPTQTNCTPANPPPVDLLQKDFVQSSGATALPAAAVSVSALPTSIPAAEGSLFDTMEWLHSAATTAKSNHSATNDVRKENDQQTTGAASSSKRLSARTRAASTQSAVLSLFDGDDHASAATDAAQPSSATRSAASPKLIASLHHSTSSTKDFSEVLIPLDAATRQGETGQLTTADASNPTARFTESRSGLSESRSGLAKPLSTERMSAESVNAEPMNAEQVNHEPADIERPIVANLIEFPRELVAVRKARPRLAEGPLATPTEGQLSIFEVESSSIEPLPEMGSLACPPSPTWAMDELEALPASQIPEPAETAASVPSTIQPAPWSRRSLAGIMDGALILAICLLVSLFFVLHAPVAATPRAAETALALMIVIVAGLYQGLFALMGLDTPGMYYAQLRLATLSDNKPTPAQMQRRVGSLILSVLPVGLGMTWALFDEDRLCWHDRLSGTYPRKAA